MTMDLAMMVAAPMANAQPQQPANAGQEAQVVQTNRPFGRILVAKVGEAAGGQNGQTNSAPAIVRKMPDGGWSNLPAGMSGVSLIDRLDALLTLLEGGDIRIPDERREAIEAALKELGALMTALFGIELPVTDDGRIVAEPQQSAADTAAEESADVSLRVAVRGGWHETIAFVRSFLAEGTFRPLTGREQAMFESLIARLENAFDPADETAAQYPEAGEASGPVIEIRTSETGNRPSAEALLARLARQPMQASVAALMSEAQRTNAAGTSGAASAAQEAEIAIQTRFPAEGALPQMAADAEAVQNAASHAVEPVPVAQAVQTANANAATHASRTETPVRQPAPAVPVERFHEIVAGMAVRHIRLTAGEGVSEARILLVPEHLGEVAVRITLQNGQLTAQFVTENAAARELIEHQFAQLRIMLQNQGIQVDRLEATQGNAAMQSHLFQEQRQRGGQARHEGGRDRRGDDAMSVFEPELIEQAAIRELGYGRAINVKA